MFRVANATILMPDPGPELWALVLSAIAILLAFQARTGLGRGDETLFQALRFGRKRQQHSN